ncbi:hypothetical protein [Phaeospirillum tilakii]|uniref:Uncharacterized protein n=1 Tax=Phaeospirillum tilakii TaxID=741673 RepID=A0ABW5CDW2_9PROT
MPSYLSARLPERTSQGAYVAAITAFATVASNPAAWREGCLELWLTLVWPMAGALLAFLFPEAHPPFPPGRSDGPPAPPSKETP